MADYFGYNKTSHGPGNILSSSMVLASINGEAVHLVQNLQIDYKRAVEFRYELGSDSVWMAAGQSSGSAQIQRAVGDKKLLAPYYTGNACDLETITVGKGNAQCGMEPGTIVASGALLVSVGASAQAGGLQVTDNAQYNIGNLTM